MAGGLSSNDTNLGHVGQLHFEQKLLNDAELLPPYSMNLTADTTNLQDTILTENSTVVNWNTMGDLGAYDPFLRYIYLTKDLADGIFA